MKIGILNSCYYPGVDNFFDVDNNTGNSVITSTLLKVLPPDTEILSSNFFKSLVKSTEEERVELARSVCEFDVVFLVLQDLIRPDAYVSEEECVYAKEILRLAKCLVVVSLGANLTNPYVGCPDAVTASRVANATPPHISAFVQFLTEKASLISVRGETTKEVIGLISPIGNVKVGGCPSLTLSDIGDLKGQAVKNQTAGKKTYIIGGLAAVRDVVSMDSTIAIYQEPHELTSSIGDTGYSGAEQLLDYVYARGSGMLFFEPDKWVSFLEKRKGEGIAYMGTRFHGLVQCLKAGIPGVLTSGDIRAKEMAELYRLPYRPVHMWVEESFQIASSYDYSLVLNAVSQLRKTFAKDLYEASGVTIE